MQLKINNDESLKNNKPIINAKIKEEEMNLISNRVVVEENNFSQLKRECLTIDHFKDEHEEYAIILLQFEIIDCVNKI